MSAFYSPSASVFAIGPSSLPKAALMFIRLNTAYVYKAWYFLTLKINLRFIIYSMSSPLCCKLHEGRHSLSCSPYTLTD